MADETLHPIADGLWGLEHDLFMPGGIHFRTRMTVARLASGGLALISPVPIEDAQAAALAELGEVQLLIAPNLFHHLFFAAAAERYPDAERLLAPGLPDKVDGLPPSNTLDPASLPAALAADFDALLIQGVPKLNEVVFLHRPSGSLIVTDLIFNIHEWKTWITGVVLWVMRAQRRVAQSRMLRMLTKDRAAAAASAQQVLSWRFSRVVPAHGIIIEEDAHEALAGALAWMLAGQAKAA